MILHNLTRGIDSFLNPGGGGWQFPEVQNLPSWFEYGLAICQIPGGPPLATPLLTVFYKQ